MKITSSSYITGKGHALFTDEPWSIAADRNASSKKKIRIADEEFNISSLGSAIGPDRVRYLVYVVPTITDKNVEESIQNKEAKLK